MKENELLILEIVSCEYFIFQTNIEIFDGNGNEDFHGGYNLQRPGAQQIDFLGRKIQEGAEQLNVSLYKVCPAVTLW